MFPEDSYRAIIKHSLELVSTKSWVGVGTAVVEVDSEGNMGQIFSKLLVEPAL